MLQLKNVSKFYYSKGIVTSGFTKVNLELNIGEFVAITGESGSGKSTLLNVLSGLDSYEEGEMYVEGEDTSAYTEKEWEKYRRKYISNIFQSFNLVNSYTVYQNVELAMLLSGYRGRDKRKKINEVLKKVDMYKFRHQRASRLSGGQKQRVAIARALVRNTPIIVADEPTGNLDSAAAANVIEMLSKVSADRLVIIVTHNYDQVENYVSRKITVSDGQIIEDMKFREIEEERKAEAENENVEQTEAEDGTTEETVSAETETEEKKEETKGVLEAKIRRVGFFQRIRLGIRNAFNVVPKFVLLFIVFLFVSAAVASYYVSNLKSQDSETTYGYSYFFNNIEPERIVIKKSNGSAISDEEFSAIKALDNVDYVVTDDLTVDTQSYLSSEMWWIDGTVYSIENYRGGKPTIGRLPKEENEILLVVTSANYLSDDSTAVEILESEFALNSEYSDSSLTDCNLKVVGIDVVDSSTYNTDIYVSDSLIALIRASVNMNYSKIKVKIDGTLQTLETDVEQYSYEYKMVPSDKILPGECTVSADVNDLFKNGKCSGSTVAYSVSNLYYSSSIELKITDTYNSKTFADKTGQDKDYYSWENGLVLVNPDDYSSLFSTDSYQSSVFVKDADAANDTVSQLETMGYVCLHVYDHIISYDSVYDDIERVFTMLRSIVLLVATFFIAYFIIQLIMKSRNTYFATVRILGATRNDCYRLIFIELFTVLDVAYAAFMGIIHLAKYGYIQLEAVSAINDYTAYLTPVHYVILYAVLFVICFAISRKYSRKLFASSAMTAYKGV